MELEKRMTRNKSHFPPALKESDIQRHLQSLLVLKEAEVVSEEERKKKPQ